MPTIIGQPVTRQDARLKVTGSAKYSAEFALPGMVHAVLVTAPVGRGTIRSFDLTEARAAIGVIKIITHEDKPKMRDLDQKSAREAKASLGEFLLPFKSPDIVYNGQAIAIVVADTYERARYAASLVKADINVLPPATTLHDAPKVEEPNNAQSQRGNPAATYAASAAKMEATYFTPHEHHNPIEPHATLAQFDKNGELTVYISNQSTTNPQSALAYVFEMDKEKVRAISHFIGGGFGCKGAGAWAHDIACVLAARETGRPVKLALMRQQMFAGVGHRGDCEMEVRIGSDKAGEIAMLSQKTLTQSHEDQPFFERAGGMSRLMYRAPNYEMAHKVARNNISPPIYTRAPGEAPGSFALECAMDEMAHQLGVDPIEFRQTNYAAVDPETGLPWSSKQLAQCYARGAAMIGWNARQMQPRMIRQGRYLIGYGMASATYPGNRSPAAAKCRLYPDGRAVAGSSGCDIGTGAYTIFRQVAADTLGYPLDNVIFELGDSKLPYAPVAGGSQLTASVAPAVVEACEMALAEVMKLALADPKSPVYNRAPDEVMLRDGLVMLKKDTLKAEPVAAVVKRSGQPYVEACCRAETMASAKNNEGLNQKNNAPCNVIEPEAEVDLNKQKYAFHSFGSQFCKLRVDEELGTIRLLDWATAIDVGRILNHRTARSQMLGGIGWGIGMALSEETMYDPQTARPVMRNLADYHVAVNADVPRIQVEFIDTPDPHINSLGCRGVGEIGIVGVAAAIANAVFNATGKRLRELPLTPDKFV